MIDVEQDLGEAAARARQAQAGQDSFKMAPTVKRARKPRRSAIARELEAFQRGYDEGAQAHGGSGFVLLFAGAVSGITLYGIVEALWRTFH